MITLILHIPAAFICSELFYCWFYIFYNADKLNSTAASREALSNCKSLKTLMLSVVCTAIIAVYSVVSGDNYLIYLYSGITIASLLTMCAMR